MRKQKSFAQIIVPYLILLMALYLAKHAQSEDYDMPWSAYEPIDENDSSANLEGAEHYSWDDLYLDSPTLPVEVQDNALQDNKSLTTQLTNPDD